MLRMADGPVLVALALGIYFAASYVLVDQWRWLPVVHARMLYTKELLDDHGRQQRRAVYFLGSSVVVDGIDCNAVDSELPPGVESFNLGGIGAGPTRWLLQEAALERAQPAAAVFVVDLLASLSNTSIPSHLAAVAGWFDMIPSQSREAIEGLLDADRELGPLYAPRYRQMLEFRSLPMVHVEFTVRESLRKDLRYEGHSTNFKAPWLRLSSVSPLAMDRSVAQTVDQLAAYSVKDLRPALTSLRLTGSPLVREDVAVVVVLAPVNPLVAEQLPPGYVEQMSAAIAATVRDIGAVYLDQAALLAADEFSDHVHPIGPGRERWSRELGQALRTVLQGEPRGHAVSDP